MTSAVLAGSIAVGGTALLCYALLKMARKSRQGNGNSGSDGSGFGGGDDGFGWAGGDNCSTSDGGGSCDGGGDGGGGGD
jgi:hypothetical protein